MTFIHQPYTAWDCPTCREKPEDMSKILTDYIEGLEKDRKKLLDLRNFVKSELSFENQPKLTKQKRSEKIHFLEKVLRIIED